MLLLLGVLCSVLGVVAVVLCMCFASVICVVFCVGVAAVVFCMCFAVVMSVVF